MRWTPDDVLDAAFATLEAEGLEKLSLRGVARTLGAHLNSVSWYVKTKQTLIETMADTIVGTVRTDDLPADAVERVRVVAHRYRAAMLAHRDGGRLVAGTYAGTGKTLHLADTIVGALLEAGYPEPDAARLCWAIVYFTLGLTQEEQTPAGTPTREFGQLLETGAYPALAKVGAQLMVADSFDARFGYGVNALLRLPPG
ncbi:TetR/AcrR family transcriptional regulator C-terminal domain-containing protein [Amycolatopsis sp., V23-08]|uniref:TetR/AcrR family transcriptional regulator C-terminal domain-containing protein n=1 Tax=Amycolatopsis heterodermiae TaxID=3110235 RepID=A0ABU5RKB5_9PSEU|nr:TetR/AcrR family transcriptional regulator C-terminal domain-containing protein [Amycolatopsis sp., V23-08]MEA5366746.1 TetR/AcrR family transcriptional regulator C-terminal domain-containing protein [Amycolatopsis sp., V23-08]